jgi:tRNA (uracil-5-)-methyltransferase TRM9
MGRTGEAFDEIAESWYRVRHWSRFNKELEHIAQRWRRGTLLNVGCAHGPDFLPFKDNFDLWGIDLSEQMVRLAVKYAAKFHFGPNLIVADALSMPFTDCTFDWAISVATYHHIQGKRQRLQSFNELRRVLKPEGEAFLTVWNRWQPRFWLRGKDTIVPWKTGGKTVDRYYHLFSYPELSSLLKQAGFHIINLSSESSYRLRPKYFSRNICALIKK